MADGPAEVTFAERETRRLWTVAAFLIGAPIVGLIAAIGEDAVGLPPLSGLLSILVAYVFGGAAALRALGVGAKWRIEVNRSGGRVIEVSYTPTLVPPSFERYVVTVDGEQVLSQRGGIGLADRLEFDLGGGPDSGPPLRVEIAVRLVTFRPPRFMPLSLDVDGHRLVEV